MHVNPKFIDLTIVACVINYFKTKITIYLTHSKSRKMIQFEIVTGGLLNWYSIPYRGLPNYVILYPFQN